MTDNALTIFDNAGGQLPAHLQSFSDEVGSNITSGLKVPSLSYEGKVWAISKDGDKQKLMRINDDGDQEPLPTMRVVVAAYNSRRGRAYYSGSYDPGNVSPPVCWSDDGVTPDSSLPDLPPDGDKTKPHKYSPKCEGCPMSVKGSSVSDSGKATVACSSYRVLAVLPVAPETGQILLDPLRLKIAITSDWDAQSPDQEAQGWRSYSKYTDLLKSRQVNHTAMVVTKMKFDPNVSYPKIFFAAERYLSEAEMAAVKPFTVSDEVQSLLSGTYTPAGVDGVKKEEPAPAQEPEIAAAPAETPAPVAEAPAPAAEAAPAPAVQPAEQTPEASTAVPAELADVLSAWSN